MRRVDKEIPVRMGGMNREVRPKKKKVKPLLDDEEGSLGKKKRSDFVYFEVMTLDGEARRNGASLLIHMRTLSKTFPSISRYRLHRRYRCLRAARNLLCQIRCLPRGKIFSNPRGKMLLRNIANGWVESNFVNPIHPQ